jgi:LysR family transcriptional regulator, transcriptional activator of nhaA
VTVNYKHLHYFWATAHAGGIVKAGARLHTSPQTISGQIKLLEDRFGRRLFRKVGRHLELTEDGHLTLRFADEIFALGAELESAMRVAGPAKRTLDFRVALADSVDKTVAYRLLEPAVQIADPVRLLCSEGTFAELLGQLALHQVDLVIADEPLPRKFSVKAFNHALGRTPVCFFAAPALRETLAGAFPACLDGAPLLLPGATSSMRLQLDNWLAERELHPRIVGEFDDSALIAAFGREGRGIFLAPSVLQAQTEAQYGVQSIGRCDDLVEHFYAISVERRLTHPCVLAITSTARGTLFGS